ncbi:hypothetical protein AB0N76_34415, partial [Kitasatospora sp. NPDC093806]
MHIASFLVFPFASFLIAWTWASRPLWKKLLSSAIAAFCCLAWIGAATSPQPAPQPPAPAVPPAATVTVTATPTPTETAASSPSAFAWASANISSALR